MPEASEETVYFWDGTNYVSSSLAYLEGGYYGISGLEDVEVMPWYSGRGTLMNKVFMGISTLIPLAYYLDATLRGAMGGFEWSCMGPLIAVFTLWPLWWFWSLRGERASVFHLVVVSWKLQRGKNPVFASKSTEYAEAVAEALNIAMAGGSRSDRRSYGIVGAHLSGAIENPAKPGYYRDALIELTPEQIAAESLMLDMRPINKARRRQVPADRRWSSDEPLVTYVRTYVVFGVLALLTGFYNGGHGIISAPWMIAILVALISLTLLVLAVVQRKRPRREALVGQVHVLEVRDSRGWIAVTAAGTSWYIDHLVATINNSIKQRSQPLTALPGMP